MTLIPFRRRRASGAPEDAIERYRRRRPVRLLAGLHVPPDFGRVEGAVVAARGAGKWLRPQVLATHRHRLPESLAETLRAAACGEASVGDRQAAGEDLAESAALACEPLLGACGDAAGEVLAVCVDEPGARWSDFDGREAHTPLFQPARFAEKTGLSVIDDLGAGDRAAGGRGHPLWPLAAWLALADRARPLALHNRVLVWLDEPIWLGLPASDGLDAELPTIRLESHPGLATLAPLIARCGGSPDDGDRLGKLAVQGRVIEGLRGQLAKDPQRPLPCDPETLERLSEGAAKSWCDLLCTVTLGIADRIERFARREGWQPDDELLLAGGGRSHGMILSGLREAFGAERVRTLERESWTTDGIAAAWTALLGLMHVDQLPASLPWLTGADVPRLHGRLTPGRPANWRRLVIEMADYHPPAMKLREAV